MTTVFKTLNLRTGRLEPLITNLSSAELDECKAMIRRIVRVADHAAKQRVRIMIDAEQTYFVRLWCAAAAVCQTTTAEKKYASICFLAAGNFASRYRTDAKVCTRARSCNLQLESARSLQIQQRARPSSQHLSSIFEKRAHNAKNRHALRSTRGASPPLKSSEMYFYRRISLELSFWR